MIFISSTVPFDQIPNLYKEAIKKDFIFGENDIEKMFVTFRENNFRENSVCEYVLG